MKKDLSLDALIEACGYGLLEPAIRLVDEGADVNGCQNGLTPLISSIYGQNIELTAFLVQSGAIVNQGRQTALHEAFDCMIMNMIDESLDAPDPVELEIAEFLVGSGADLDKRNDLGETPLDYLNKHSADRISFEKLKSSFRSLVPDIDEKVEFRAD